MKKIVGLLFSAAILGSLAFNPPDTVNYKCMIQLTNYEGEGAYIVVSILDGEGNYQETLHVQGEDKEWYRDIETWWKNVYGIQRPDLDAVVGATISGGQRKMMVLQIPSEKIDAGFKIRFESAVEDQEYYVDDVEFDLTYDNLRAKIEGNGFIRYVRMMPQ
jgi:hypothetical protein